MKLFKKNKMNYVIAFNKRNSFLFEWLYIYNKYIYIKNILTRFL